MTLEFSNNLFEIINLNPFLKIAVEFYLLAYFNYDQGLNTLKYLKCYCITFLKYMTAKQQ